jgi:Na+/H+-dicarboxylate symporter
MKFHWKVLLWMLAGALLGLVFQTTLAAPAWMGATWEPAAGGLELVDLDGGGPAARARMRRGDVVTDAVVHRGTAREERVPLRTAERLDEVVASHEAGEVVWLELATGKSRLVTLGMAPSSPRVRAVAPFDFLADIFMALLQMLIVPIVFTSIVTGIAGVGTLKDLRRLGGKTFAYYIGTSLLAILVGQVLVSLVRPGEGAELGLTRIDAEDVVPDESFVEVLKRMVPANVFESFTDNSAMLQIIFFALLFGFFLTQTPDPWRERVFGFFEALFQVVMRLAEGVLKLLPYGVFCLLLRVVAKTGFAVFEPLLVYMAVVTAALVIHCCFTLPVLLATIGRLSPLRWAKAMSPALMTAFSTSSSSMTLPVTLETVERRGRVSNRVTSFTLPLGATINMDGTALYECVGVIFLAQYYASTGDFDLTLGKQALVVIMALLASIGAAGIPSAGLVMMLTILSALKLPLEGAALLLAVDRPLDMLRTVTNVWSDTCGAAVIARSEGEEGPALAGAVAAEP